MRRGMFLLGAVWLLSEPERVEACGGCFQRAPPVETGTGTVSGSKRAQVITDHRMVLSLSSTRTTLWDQIRYAGDPDDFIWVLPVPHGQTLDVGLGDNAFVDALDRVSVPVIESHVTQTCYSDGTSRISTYDSGYGSSAYGGSSGGGGCGGGPTASIDYTPGSRGGGTGYDAGSSGGSQTKDYRGAESVMVGAMGVATVGPYAVDRVENGAGAEGFEAWAGRAGYVIPEETREAVRYYTSLSMDFLVLRLRPDAGVQQMQPVRISYPGYQPSLPLRMIAAGVADKVGLLLMVIAQTSVEARGFTNEIIETSDLVWDFSAQRSNYRQLFNQRMLYSRGTWVMESLQHVARPMEMAMPTASDAGAGEEEFSPVHDQIGEAIDAGSAPRRPNTTLDRSDPYVDRRIAFEGLSGAPMITRLRTELRRADLSRDLVLDASPRAPLSPQREISRAINLPPCPVISPAFSYDAGVGSSGRSIGFCSVAPHRRWGSLFGPLGLLAAGLAHGWRRARRSPTP